MTSKQIQLRIQQLKIRVWIRIATAFVYVSFALFLAIEHVMVGVLIFSVFAGISARTIVKSAEELSKLKDRESEID
jgi:membrane protein implicated in regulation of membrane protease activity